MSQSHAVTSIPLSLHVLQIVVPTPTLPPSFSTNSYLIYSGAEGILVDCGSDDARCLRQVEATIRKVGVRRIRGLIATHWHRDHVTGLPPLARLFNAPIYVHALDLVHASETMQIPARDVTPVPHSFSIDDVDMTVVHAPGHTHGHIHLQIYPDGVILVGDHLAGDGSVWIGPPDGHMSDYFRSLDAIVHSGCKKAGPGHGVALDDAVRAGLSFKERRRAREEEIYAFIAERPVTVAELVDHLYRNNIPASALYVAKKTVQAHLAHLLEHQRIRNIYDPNSNKVYYRAVTEVDPIDNHST